MSHDSSSAIASPSSKLDVYSPPGGIVVWVILFLELFTFGAGLGVFLAEARWNPAEFAEGRALLNQPIGLINTMILLTGGWCMANGLGALRLGKNGIAQRWINGAIASGGLFFILKMVEYSEKISHGVPVGEDVFYTMYFAITGFHLIHVLVGMLLLFLVVRGIKSGLYHKDHHLGVESSGIFWHMCDIIWLLVYPTIYLL